MFSGTTERAWSFLLSATLKAGLPPLSDAMVTTRTIPFSRSSTTAMMTRPGRVLLLKRTMSLSWSRKYGRTIWTTIFRSECPHRRSQAPLRSDAEAVTDQEHPDHQLGIDRRSTDAAIERRQVPPDLFKIDKPVNQPQQVISRDMSFERELIEQRGLFDLPMPHHDLQSCQLDRLNH
ncbi:hypothetical protein XH94_17975 [Bradyrhizobium zhanjiangense]|uniref:Uncharacterized protein n=1 Tax=Bradyrhizobium zhanjiangense TaxID=1325107 RepID=A0A4Q0SNQ4_9BRAD|nr:hypothetical protein XH94_17975 [Bradyrhizobium zhanjiangense]